MKLDVVITGKGPFMALKDCWLSEMGDVVEAPHLRDAEEVKDHTRCDFVVESSTYEEDFGTVVEHMRGDRNDYYARRVMVDFYGWAIPTQEVINEIVKLGPIVEIGAGRGYWARRLREAGADVVAYDNWARTSYRRRTWTKVEEGGPPKLVHHEDRVLLLVWPEYFFSVGSKDYRGDLMYRAVKKYRGDTVVFVGEGMGGCTGSKEGHELLGKKFEFTESFEIPQWGAVHDQVEVYRTSGASGQKR